MNIFELFILAIGLSMDAFAVSVCKGLSLGKINARHMCIAGAWFGGFQALMPLIGYFGGCFFAGMNTHLSKPIVIEEVIKTILRYVHNDQQRFMNQWNTIDRRAKR